VIIYERLRTDHIYLIHQVVKASTPRLTFEGALLRLHEKLWLFCDIKQMNKWSIHSAATSRAMPEKELKLW
jgi:hypothetical protein